MKKISLLILSVVLLFFTGGCVTTSVGQKQAVAAKSLLFWDKDAGSPSERFEIAKNSVPELTAFLLKMPKGADLHNHVSGATYSDYILDSAEKNGLFYDLGTNLFFRQGDPSYTPLNPISIDSLKTNSIYLSQFLNSYSMRGWFPDSVNGHDHFFQTFNYISSANRSDDDMLVEVVKRNLYQNVQYLELMINSLPPNFIALFQNVAPDFDMKNLDRAFAQAEEAVKNASFDVNASIRNFLNDREANLIANGIPLGPGNAIVIRYIQQLKRSTNDMRKFFLSAYYSIYGSQVDSRIVGVNIVQAEDTPFSRVYFNDEITILDYLWNKMNRPKFSLHAGELVLKESPVEPMQSRISDTIKRGHALRIGHGISVAWENDLPTLLKTMKEKGIAVEICLSSNESILGVKEDSHPFILYRKAGVPTVLCTDDEGVNRVNLTLEYVKAVKRYALSYTDVKNLSRNSIEYSFLDGESLYLNHDYTRIRDEFKGIDKPDYKPSEKALELLKKNPKLERQYTLERAYVAFEDKLYNSAK